jgi:hypothetical protein
MPQVESKKTVIHKFDYQIIGDFVVFKRLHDKDQDYPVVCDLEWFEQQRAKKRGWSFLNRNPHKNLHFMVVSKKYWEAYRKGKHYEVDYDDMYIDPIRYLKKNWKDPERLICDYTSQDGWFYSYQTAKRKCVPVWSKIFFNSSDTPFTDMVHDLDYVIDMNKHQKNKDFLIENLEIVYLPYYLASNEVSEKVVTFTLVPSEKYFEEILAKTYRNGLKYEVKEILKKRFTPAKLDEIRKRNIVDEADCLLKRFGIPKGKKKKKKKR